MMCLGEGLLAATAAARDTSANTETSKENESSE